MEAANAERRVQLSLAHHKHDQLVHSQGLESRRFGVAKKDGIYLLHHIASDLKETSLVFKRDEGALRTVVHGNLQRFDERPDALNIALYAEIAEDQQCWRLWMRTSYHQLSLGGEGLAYLTLSHASPQHCHPRRGLHANSSA